MFANASLKTKVVSIAAAIGLAVSLVLGVELYQITVAPVKNEVSQEIVADMKNFIDSQLELKIQGGIIGSTAVSMDKSIVEAIQVEEREDIMKKISNIRDQYKNQTNYKNI